MAKQQKQIPIKGSRRFEIPDAKRIGSSDPAQKIKVSIYARRNPNPSAGVLSKIDQLSTALPKNRQYLSNKEFDEVYGADPKEINAIVSWAKKNNLSVNESNISEKRVLVEGTIKDIGNAFNVEFSEYEHHSLGRYRGRTGQVYIPEDLYGIIEGVFGLDTRPIGHSRCKRGRGSAPWDEFVATGIADKKKAPSTPTNKWPGTFFPPQVAGLYNYPTGTDGTGQNVAIFAFNGDGPGGQGGYKLSALQTYFEKVLGQKTPEITDVVIQGPGNDPGPDTQASSNNGDSTGEVMLDMCVVGSAAPGAKIFMYFTEFNSQGWVDALHNAIAGTNNISVISISYGNPEQDPQSAWTSMALNVVNQALEASNAKGITICCASGDSGSNDGSQNMPEVDFPASSPFVLGVGGTKVVASANLSTITSETVWNEMFRQGGAGGGGISAIFSKPVYQNTANVPPSANPSHGIGRGVPDVAALADPYTGVVIMNVNGKSLEPIGGTSAAAPLWASLILRLNQALNAPCGFLNTLLYTKFATNVLNDITVGNNGAYSAGPGWDACTGLGSPDGEKLLDALK
jgi:kumamolisin